MLENHDELTTKYRRRYQQLNRLISDPEVIDDQDRWQAYVIEHSQLKEVVEALEKYEETIADLEEAEALLIESDGDVAWLREEQEQLQTTKDEMERKIKQLIIPKDPRDKKNVIIEIRAGAGGDEAGLFAADLYRMYVRFAERQGWSFEVLNRRENDLGGFKEISFSIDGKGAFSRFKYESGVHRVQRIPSTESGGRIHTSTATVAVLPEAERVDVQIDRKDLDIDTYHASGPGGQHVNKTESAVRITHRPTGVVVTCQDEKSQHKNKERAMKVLRARLYDMKQRERDQARAEKRRSQVGTGDRSERIRTYNFPQNRVTDHRIQLTTHQLEAILDGQLEMIVDPLTEEDRAEKLAEVMAGT